MPVQTFPFGPWHIGSLKPCSPQRALVGRWLRWREAETCREMNHDAECRELGPDVDSQESWKMLWLWGGSVSGQRGTGRADSASRPLCEPETFLADCLLREGGSHVAARTWEMCFPWSKSGRNNLEKAKATHPILYSPHSGSKCWEEVGKLRPKEKRRCGGKCTSDRIVLFSVLL